MKRSTSFVIAGLLAAAVGCGGGAGSGKGPVSLSKEKDSGFRTTGNVPVSKQAAEDFQTALRSFVAHDKAFDWAEGSCKGVADQFVKASETQKSDTNRSFPSALYNAGLAYQRCGMDDSAQKQFKAALDAERTFHRAETQLTLYEYQRTKDLEGTINQLNRIIRDAKFQNVEALVGVAALQMERGGDQTDSDGKNDFDRALRNIQRALAVDDSYMPAFNQLAIYYFEQAKAKAGTRKGRRRGLVVASAKKADVNQQMLDLAALVASQAVRKNPKYAAIHNTVGLIQVELRNYNGAVKSFKRARELDPKFFEAHMNYGAVNLGFRGFQEAERAYRDALRLQPREFEAHLGLALALRGQIAPGNWDKQISETQKHLDEAKKIDGARPEPYYNEAILTQEYRAKGGSDEKNIPTLEKAKGIYEQFIGKAEGREEFADAVKRSKERVQDIEDIIKFIREGIEARKADEAAQRAAKAAPKPAPAPAAAPAKPPAKK